MCCTLPVASHFSCSYGLLYSYGKCGACHASSCCIDAQHAMRRTVGRAMMQSTVWQCQLLPAPVCLASFAGGSARAGAPGGPEGERSNAECRPGATLLPRICSCSPSTLALLSLHTRSNKVGRWGEGRDLSGAASEPLLGSRVQAFLSVGENVVVDGSSPRRSAVRGWLAIAAGAVRHTAPLHWSEAAVAIHRDVALASSRAAHWLSHAQRIREAPSDSQRSQRSRCCLLYAASATCRAVCHWVSRFVSFSAQQLPAQCQEVPGEACAHYAGFRAAASRFRPTQH